MVCFLNDDAKYLNTVMDIALDLVVSGRVELQYAMRDEVRDFFCDVPGCTYVAKGKFQLAGHKSNGHRVHNPIHRFVTSNSCAACGLQFANSERILKHVCYSSTRCGVFFRPLLK